jgi:enamine deaminase RidA (YjgF/YER057c/UK114 family)
MNSLYEDRLEALGLTLPPVPKPLSAYIPAVRTGNLLFLSGIIPSVNGTLLYPGKVGRELTLDEGKEAARITLLNALAVIQGECGSLNSVRRIIRLSVHVASAEGFTDQSKVADGASNLLVDIFGENGRHARLALGAVELPFGAPIELEMIVELHDSPAAPSSP